jgi:hypothetical protein
MKIRMKAIAAAMIAMAAAQAAPAAGLVVEGSGARSEGSWGVEGSLGYRIGMLGFAITPAIGAFATRSDTTRYLEQPDPAGGTQCRDSQSGAIVRDFRCENADFRPFGRIEATYAIPLIAEAGVGVRVTKDSTVPYGTVAVPIFPMAKLKGNVGDGYAALGLRVGF